MSKGEKILFAPWFYFSIALLFLAIMPLFASRYYLYLGIEMLIVSLFALSTNILLGYTGLLSFGQAAYFGIGAYTISLILKTSGMPFLIAILCSAGFCALAAMIIGFFCIHLRSFYFAILTLSFSQMFYAVAYKWIRLTGGDDGIVGIPKPPVLGIELSSTTNYYYFVLIIVSVCIGAIYLIIKSPFGEILQAIRDNPERAEFSGVNIKKYRLGAFIIAGLFAGVSGSIFAPSQSIVTPELLHWSTSTEPLLISILGGMYTFSGPLAGSVIFVLVKNWITGYTEYWMVWYGLLLLLLIMYLPGGVMGFLSEKMKVLQRNAE